MTLTEQPTTAGAPIAETPPGEYDAVLVDLAASVPGGQTIEFAITPLDVTRVPVWTVTRWQDDGEMLNGIGYGLTDDRARVGGWAELLEQAAGHHAIPKMNRRTATYAQLKREGVAVLDPLELRLPAGSTYTHEMSVVWVEAHRLDVSAADFKGEPTWVPVEAAATHNFDCRLPAGTAPLYQCISNGSGAGDTIERALTHALLELVQRDGNSAGYRACDRGIKIELDGVRHPQTRELLARLDAAGIDVLVKLADTNLGMTNLYVVGRDRGEPPHPICLTGCGEAAHPDREQALLKALTEYCASRVRKLYTHGPLELQQHLFPPGYLDRFTDDPATVEESRSFQAVSEWMNASADEVLRRLEPTIFRVERTVKFSDLPTVPMDSANDTGTLLNVVADRYAADKLDVFWVDLSPEGKPCSAVKVIAPAMEVETVTYHRVGVRNLKRLIERGYDFVGLGAPPSGAKQVPLSERMRTELGDDAWLHPERADALLGPLYGLYREPDIHAIPIQKLANGGN